MKHNKIIERLVEITEKNTLLNSNLEVNKEQVNQLLKEHNSLLNQLKNIDSDSSSELSPEDIKNLQEALKDSDNESDFKTPEGSITSLKKTYGKEGNDFGTSQSASDASIERLKNGLNKNTSEKDTKKTRKTRKRKFKAGSPIKKNTSLKSSVKKTKKVKKATINNSDVVRKIENRADANEQLLKDIDNKTTEYKNLKDNLLQIIHELNNNSKKNTFKKKKLLKQKKSILNELDSLNNNIQKLSSKAENDIKKNVELNNQLLADISNNSDDLLSGDSFPLSPSMFSSYNTPNNSGNNTPSAIRSPASASSTGLKIPNIINIKAPLSPGTQSIIDEQNKKSSSSKSKKAGAPSKNTRSSSMKLRSNKLIKKANTTIKKKKLYKPQSYTYFQDPGNGEDQFYKKLKDKNLKNGDTINYIPDNQLGIKIYKVINGKPKIIHDGADILSENSTNSSIGGGVFDSIKGVFSTRKKCKNEHSKNFDCDTNSIYTKLRNKKIAIKETLQNIQKDRDDKLIQIKGKDYKKTETNKDKIMKSIFGNEDAKIELTEKEEKDLFDDSISQSLECKKKKQIAIDSCVESKK